MKLKGVKVAILTMSDKGARGERVDTSGPEIRSIVEAEGAIVFYYEVIPDEQYEIEERLVRLADLEDADLILTTGGTGFSPRDVTPEATLAVIERNAPGFVEAIRHASLKITPHAMLSRAVSGMRGQTLIINLPGSPKAVRESLQVVMPALPHGLEILKCQTGECAVTTQTGNDIDT
ncbi:MAG: molybdenum cofactor biosynthesis protein [Candidatus Aquicultor secundus]|uniref:Molybdenum cofactor biosynthesis protein B n=2 Tax=Candidatus Aquicultor secundus TaxID=1973895 RepID=A0A2M7T4V3_9ACTN|nr:MogA/MoaB family molybdenum cofactor biosynthesis protein [Candidatus Aquicultor secundus]NCO65005.1 MogA/MoaB family molybdenum cofactor biosynthesis protein [Solirubrobacter sp.]OIO87514.1 MAG: molybdenum cofactor biosynthesis protein [Candidatus Aquicultor secundus]PIU26008.1 MAG: molybdenum cofactor biosynthesis protein [Candidatus Aquicultor secundus]PIW22297.1 MAG: molybdenum cofactor biosynthesis protein [Candidatus Aquicultor secundus]PIX51707.1 MAG: molybdenum cofactor biosynthesis